MGTLTTYTHTDFEQIATAIGIRVKPVANLQAQFEAAALWFRLDKRRPGVRPIEAACEAVSGREERTPLAQEPRY